MFISLTFFLVPSDLLDKGGLEKVNQSVINPMVESESVKNHQLNTSKIHTFQIIPLKIIKPLVFSQGQFWGDTQDSQTQFTHFLFSSKNPRTNSIFLWLINQLRLRYPLKNKVPPFKNHKGFSLVAGL